jgi:hypothetical protein
MATTLQEVKVTLGEYFPILAQGLEESSDLFAAIAPTLDALKAGALSWACLNQCLHRCSEAGMSEGCFRYYFLDAPPDHPYPVERVFSAVDYKPRQGLTEIVSLQQVLRSRIRPLRYRFECVCSASKN